MKPFMFLLLLFFILKISYAQTGASEFMVLSVEKKSSYGNDPVILQFKPQSFLKIKTIDGKELRTAKYTYQDSALVMFSPMGNGIVNIDTIPFRDIIKIRGKVYGNAERKAAGTILALTGLPLLGFTSLAAGYSYNPMGTAMALLPAFAIPASGISLMGARSFKTNEKWILKTTRSTKINAL